MDYINKIFGIMTDKIWTDKTLESYWDEVKNEFKPFLEQFQFLISDLEIFKSIDIDSIQQNIEDKLNQEREELMINSMENEENRNNMTTIWINYRWKLMKKGKTFYSYGNTKTDKLNN